MSDFAEKWFSWLDLDEKWRPKLTESLKNIEIDGQFHKMSWEEQIAYLSSSWIEKATEFVSSSSKNGIKLQKSHIPNNQEYEYYEDTSLNEKSTKFVSSSIEKVTKLPNKKLQYILTILFISGTPVSRDELTDIFSYQNRVYFSQNYLKPLEAKGFIRKTNPEKPNASNQKYLITEQGKQFLTGKED